MKSQLGGMSVLTCINTSWEFTWWYKTPKSSNGTSTPIGTYNIQQKTSNNENQETKLIGTFTIRYDKYVSSFTNQSEAQERS